ncbi:MAG: hypothetical protein U0835_23750 [Isosphaeraceae bacterium]
MLSGRVLLRGLILLLVMRVAAAPFALPETRRHPVRSVLVPRVCKWPAQKPENPVSLLPTPDDVPLSSAFAYLTAFDLGLADQTLGLDELLRARASAASVHVHVCDCARC